MLYKVNGYNCGLNDSIDYSEYSEKKKILLVGQTIMGIFIFQAMFCLEFSRSFEISFTWTNQFWIHWWKTVEINFLNERLPLMLVISFVWSGWCLSWWHELEFNSMLIHVWSKFYYKRSVFFLYKKTEYKYQKTKV